VNVARWVLSEPSKRCAVSSLNRKFSQHSFDLFGGCGEFAYPNKNDVGSETQAGKGYFGGKKSDRDCFGDISDSEPDESCLEESECVAGDISAADESTRAENSNKITNVQ
jgi:hypothetical protein